MPDDGFVLNQVARVIAARVIGDTAALALGMAGLIARDPAWATEPERLLRHRLPSPEVARRVAEALTGVTRFAELPPEALRGGRGGCLGDRPL